MVLLRGNAQSTINFLLVFTSSLTFSATMVSVKVNRSERLFSVTINSDQPRLNALFYMIALLLRQQLMSTGGPLNQFSMLRIATCYYPLLLK